MSRSAGYNRRHTQIIIAGNGAIEFEVAADIPCSVVLDLKAGNVRRALDRGATDGMTNKDAITEVMASAVR